VSCWAIHLHAADHRCTHPTPLQASLPQPPGGHKWCRLLDSALPSPRDITPGGNAGVGKEYGVQGRSCIVLISKPAA
jgi:isoamylase